MVFEHLRNRQHLYTGRSRIGKLQGFFHCLCTFEKIMWMVPNAQRGKLIAKPIAAFPLCGYELMRCNPRPWAAKRLAHRKTHLVTKTTHDKNEIIKNPYLGCADRDEFVGFALDDHSPQMTSNKVRVDLQPNIHMLNSVWANLNWMVGMNAYIGSLYCIEYADLAGVSWPATLPLMEPWHNMKHSCEVSTLSCSATLHMIKLMHHDVQEMLHPSISCSFMTGCEPTKTTFCVGK